MVRLSVAGAPDWGNDKGPAERLPVLALSLSAECHQIPGSGLPTVGAVLPKLSIVLLDVRLRIYY
jgi:hypothetical protein